MTAIKNLLPQRLKEHIEMDSAKLSTYPDLRDEVINYSMAKRAWTQQPVPMQVDDVVPKKGKGKGKDKGQRQDQERRQRLRRR